MPRIFSVDRHMHDRSDGTAFNIRNIQLFHQLVVSRRYRHPIHDRGHAAAADFLNIPHPGMIQFLSVSPADALADRVRGRALRQRRIFQKLLILQLTVVDPVDFKYAFGERPCLVKYNQLCLRQCFQIIRSFDQNSRIARAANPRKETKRNTDDQRARTADHKKCQGTVYPGSPVRRKPEKQHSGKRRQKRQSQCTVTDDRRIIFGKFRDKRFRSGFVRCGILHQFQNLRYRRFAKLLCRLHTQNTGHIDTSADDLLALHDLPRQALPGQRACVQCGISVHNDAVDRHFLSRLYDDLRSDRHLVGIDSHQFALLFHICIIRTDVHQFADIFTALSDRIALEQFSDLIEQHDRDRFGIISGSRKPDGDRTKRCDDHQEILIENPSVQNPAECLSQNVISDHQIRDHIQYKTQDSRRRKQFQYDHHHCRDQNPRKHFFLLLIHLLNLHIFLFYRICFICSRVFTRFSQKHFRKKYCVKNYLAVCFW